MLQIISQYLFAVFFKNTSKNYVKQTVLIFDWKQFALNELSEFQKGHSTDYAIVQLADQTHDMFNKNIYTQGVFIYLSKAFDTVDYQILLKKLSHDVIKKWKL